jgi:transcriptional regulator with XRE-family HTH domain
MTDEPGPAIRRRKLGNQLRDLRIAGGLRTIAAAAESTGLSTATISRVESAKQVILPKTVRTLCHAYGVGAPMLDHLLRLASESDDRGWLLEYSDTVPNWFERYVSEEFEASEICTYQVECVPGLLQTDSYTKAITAAARPDVTEEDLERSVVFRRARKERLDSDNPPKLVAIINEGAIRRLVGGPDVMHEQLLRLLDLMARPNITVLVLPFTAGAHPAMINSFTLLHFPTDVGMATVYVEVNGGALYPDRPSDFDHYTWMVTQLKALSLSPDDTADLFIRLAAELNPGE